MNSCLPTYRRRFARTECAGRPSVASVARMQDGPRKNDERREESLRARYKERLTRRPNPLIFHAFRLVRPGVLSYVFGLNRGLAPGGRRFSVLYGAFVAHSRLYETHPSRPFRVSSRRCFPHAPHSRTGFADLVRRLGGPRG